LTTINSLSSTTGHTGFGPGPVGVAMRIEEICNQNVIAIGAEASIHEAARLMRTRHVGCLVVTNDDDGERVPVGMITDRDIDAGVLTVGDVMTRPVVVCGLREELFEALERMRGAGVRRLPVVDGHGTLAGLLSVDDIISALGWHLQELSRALTSEQMREMSERV